MINSCALVFKDHFHIPPEDLQTFLKTALSRGGDFAELFLEYRIFNAILMEDDIIKETSESVGLGLGIRVISGDKTGYGYTNDISSQAIRKTALTAASIADGNRDYTPPPLYPKPPSRNLFILKKPASAVSLADKIELVKSAYASAQQHDSKITKVRASLTDLIQYVTIVNSEGTAVTDVRPMVKLVCLAVAEKGSEREAGFYGGGGRVGYEYFQHDLKPETIGREAAGEALHLLDAEPAPAGEMPVVLSAGHSGVLIHEAVGHLLEADFIRKKTSVFWDKMGKKVASDRVTIYDDPTIPYFRGSYNVDDEGIEPQKTLLIDKGRLSGLLQDRLSAKILNMTPTGHGRRQDYSSIPIPRMSNTYIEHGEYDREEIIRSVKKGFYAHHFQGGQVEDTGKFTFSVSSGYLIEDGRLTTPVKQATLIGSNIAILNSIEMVGSDLTYSLQTGICGKDGQEAPVSDGCPTMKITSMTVGGAR
ncbi:MAG: TldD/PmbA family protein [Acidobacteria bacterium]|nr:TldD/PmbA family protein [Acidobacteriota bacterium]